MLQNDCAKADLSTADDAAQVGKPDMSSGYHVTWADIPAEPQGILKSSSAVIRGPPPFDAAAASWPPVFLTTLRIRQ